VIEVAKVVAIVVANVVVVVVKVVVDCSQQIFHKVRRKCVGSIEILELERVCMHWSAISFLGGKEHFVNNWLISTLDNVIYFKWNKFSGAYIYSLSSLHKIARRSAEKNYPFFQTCS
jgi:hypothetical protein